MKLLCPSLSVKDRRDKTNKHVAVLPWLAVGTSNCLTSDPFKRDQGCNPPGTYYPQRRWVPHTQEIDVFFVILNGQQHSAHFSKEEADSVAFDLSVEHNYEGHPEECGYSEISVLSFMEMMESPVEMVL